MLLTAYQKCIKQVTAEINLVIVNIYPNVFLHKILSVDETLVHYFDPQSRLQTMEDHIRVRPLQSF